MFDKDFVTIGTLGVIKEAALKNHHCEAVTANKAGKFDHCLLVPDEKEEGDFVTTNRKPDTGTSETAGRPDGYHQMIQRMLQARNDLATENEKLKEEKRQLLELVRDLYGTISTDCEYTAGILERYEPASSSDMISFLHMERINAEQARLEIMAEIGVPETFPEETDGLENFGESEDSEADVPFR